MDEVKRVNYFLPRDLVRRIRVRAAEEERSPSEIVREAVEAYLKGQKRPNRGGGRAGE